MQRACHQAEKVPCFSAFPSFSWLSLPPPPTVAVTANKVAARVAAAGFCCNVDTLPEVFAITGVVLA